MKLVQKKINGVPCTVCNYNGVAQLLVNNNEIHLNKINQEVQIIYDEQFDHSIEFTGFLYIENNSIEDITKCIELNDPNDKLKLYITDVNINRSFPSRNNFLTAIDCSEFNYIVSEYARVYETDEELEEICKNSSEEFVLSVNNKFSVYNVDRL